MASIYENSLPGNVGKECWYSVRSKETGLYGEYRSGRLLNWMSAIFPSGVVEDLETGACYACSVERIRFIPPDASTSAKSSIGEPETRSYEPPAEGVNLRIGDKVTYRLFVNGSDSFSGIVQDVNLRLVEINDGLKTHFVNTADFISGRVKFSVDSSGA